MQVGACSCMLRVNQPTSLNKIYNHKESGTCAGLFMFLTEVRIVDYYEGYKKYEEVVIWKIRISTPSVK